MLATRLINLPVEVRSRGPSGTDDYGNEVPGTITTTETVAYVEQTESRELVVDRQTVTADWLVLLPAQIVIDASDHVVVGLAILEVVGKPWRVINPRTRSESHIECRCRSVEG